MFDAQGLSQGYRTSNTRPGRRLSEGKIGLILQSISWERLLTKYNLLVSKKIQYFNLKKISGNRSPPCRHLTRQTYIVRAFFEHFWSSMAFSCLLSDLQTICWILVKQAILSKKSYPFLGSDHLLFIIIGRCPHFRTLYPSFVGGALMSLSLGRVFS